MTEICNSDYEGDVKNQGDKVQISTVPDISIGDYRKGMTITLQNPDSDNIELEVDKAKYFAFAIDDIDKYQSHLPLMDAFAEDGTTQMSIVIERDDVFQNIYADAHASNKGASAGAKSGDINLGASGSPLEVTKVNVLDTIVDCMTVLDEQNVPAQNRWGVIPMWLAGHIMKSDLKDASLAGDATSIIRNGRIGRIADMTLYKSNTLYSTTDGSDTVWHSLFGQKSSTCFASQITKSEHIRPSLTFEQGIKALNVYGYKVTKTEALIDLYIKKGTL